MLFDFLGLYSYYGHKILTWFRAWHFLLAELHRSLLGGPWDLVTPFNWDVITLIIGVTPISPFREIIIRRVITIKGLR